MNLEQLEKGNQIVKEIEKCKANIKASNYTQLEGVVVRKTYLKVNGLDESIEVPENLFRIIGKLIMITKILSNSIRVGKLYHKRFQTFSNSSKKL
jgi:hypothetical protein